MAIITLYFQNNAPPYTPTTKRGAWDAATSTEVFGLGVKLGAGYEFGYGTTSMAADYDVLHGRFVSSPLGANTFFSGTINGVIGFSEAATTENSHLHLHVFVLVGQTNVLRGTLWTDYIDSNEASTSSLGDGFSGTMSDLQVFAGDTIVVEVGARFNKENTTNYSSSTLCGTTDATDLTIGGDAHTYPGWIQLTSTPDKTILVAPITATGAKIEVPSIVWTSFAGATGDQFLAATASLATPRVHMGTWASGGTITTDGQYTVHKFTTSDVFVCDVGTKDGTILVIGGGGGGASGGGGAGGYIATTTTLSAGTVTVTVGAGGTGKAYNTSSGNSGTNSIFGTNTAVGGGGGGNFGANGVTGGSGGGGGSGYGTLTGGGYTSGQGYNGGSNGGFTASPYPAGGGGGASAVGAIPVSSTIAGPGGAGLNNSITGASVGYAGGGGGGNAEAAGTAGTATHGGGAGKVGSAGNGTAGTAGTGGGGGGCGTGGTAGNGASGVVIIRYLATATANTTITLTGSMLAGAALMAVPSLSLSDHTSLTENQFLAAVASLESPNLYIWQILPLPNVFTASSAILEAPTVVRTSTFPSVAAAPFYATNATLVVPTLVTSSALAPATSSTATSSTLQEPLVSITDLLELDDGALLTATAALIAPIFTSAPGTVATPFLVTNAGVVAPTVKVSSKSVLSVFCAATGIVATPTAVRAAVSMIATPLFVTSSTLVAPQFKIGSKVVVSPSLASGQIGTVTPKASQVLPAPSVTATSSVLVVPTIGGERLLSLPSALASGTIGPPSLAISSNLTLIPVLLASASLQVPLPTAGTKVLSTSVGASASVLIPIVAVSHKLETNLIATAIFGIPSFNYSSVVIPGPILAAATTALPATVGRGMLVSPPAIINASFVIPTSVATTQKHISPTATATNATLSVPNVVTGVKVLTGPLISTTAVLVIPSLVAPGLVQPLTAVAGITALPTPKTSQLHIAPAVTGTNASVITPTVKTSQHHLSPAQTATNARVVAPSIITTQKLIIPSANAEGKLIGPFSTKSSQLLPVPSATATNSLFPTANVGAGLTVLTDAVSAFGALLLAPRYVTTQNLSSPPLRATASFAAILAATVESLTYSYPLNLPTSSIRPYRFPLRGERSSARLNLLLQAVIGDIRLTYKVLSDAELASAEGLGGLMMSNQDSKAFLS
jgi:hypothetical protein